MQKQKNLWVSVLVLVCFQVSYVNAEEAKKVEAAKTEVAATPTPAASPAAVEVAKVEDKKEAEEVYGKQNPLLGDFQVGPYVSALSIPRPVAFGIESKFKNTLGVSVGYGMFPQMKIGDVSLKITGIDARLKWYPFAKSFYIGVGFGSQTITASSTQDISGQTVIGTVNQDNTFVAPHLGWNWTWGSGFFMGMDLGVQISMKTNSVFSSDQTNPVITGSTEYINMKNDIESLANTAGKIPLPILTLIKFGYFF